MSKFLKALTIGALLFAPAIANADGLGLGRPATLDEVAAWDTDIRPDGKGLPEGHGSVLEGEELFLDMCAGCHGDFGEGVGRWPVLSGGEDSLADERPVKTIGSYWPYLSTAYDYIQRAMPFGYARSLTNDETYALVAYLLYVNDTVDDEEFVLSKENFLDVQQANADGFFFDNRPEVEYPVFSKEVCMSECKADVAITARAAIVDVTPDETNDDS